MPAPDFKPQQSMQSGMGAGTFTKDESGTGAGAGTFTKDESGTGAGAFTKCNRERARARSRNAIGNGYDGSVKSLGGSKLKEASRRRPPAYAQFGMMTRGPSQPMVER